MTGPLDNLRPRSWTVGDIVIHRVLETAFSAETAAWLLPDATPALASQVDWLGDPWTDAARRPRLASQCFALEVDGERILIDAGVGNGKTHDNAAFNGLETDFLERLAEVGFTPDNVDLILVTHLHADHVGWLTRQDDDRWVPTFPQARHVTSRTEWDYWAGAEVEPSRRRMFDESVVPVTQARLMHPVAVGKSGTEVARGVTLVPTPGHTPGHSSVRLTSGGHTALVTGDAVHHPFQVAFPELCSCVDVDPAAAVRTRLALLAAAMADGALVLGTHFPDPTAIRVRKDRGAYRPRADPT